MAFEYFTTIADFLITRCTYCLSYRSAVLYQLFLFKAAKKIQFNINNYVIVLESTHFQNNCFMNFFVLTYKNHRVKKNKNWKKLSVSLFVLYPSSGLTDSALRALPWVHFLYILTNIFWWNDFSYRTGLAVRYKLALSSTHIFMCVFFFLFFFLTNFSMFLFYLSGCCQMLNQCWPIQNGEEGQCNILQ